MTLLSQDVQVTGAVYRLANPLLNTSGVTQAARVGDAAPTAAISVTNQSPDAFTEALNVSLGTGPAGFTGSGAITGLAAQGTDAGSLSVALDTSSAGSFSGNLGVNFTSSGAGTTGAADLALASGTVGLTGRVYQPAGADLQTGAVDFGIVHVGDAIGTKSVTVANSAAVRRSTTRFRLALPACPRVPSRAAAASAALTRATAAAPFRSRSTPPRPVCSARRAIS